MTTNTCPVVMTTGFDPGDVLVAVPYLVGYDPQDSLVCILLDQFDGIAVTARFDWHDVTADPAGAAVQVAIRSAPSGGVRAILVAVSPSSRRRWRRTLSIMGRRLDRLGCEVVWSGLVRQDGWEGSLCLSHGCTVHPLPEPADSDLVLNLVVAGAAPAATRAEVLAEMSAPPGSEPLPPVPPPSSDLESWRDATVAQILALVARDSPPDDTDAAQLAAGLADIRVRDTVLHRITTAQPPGSNGTWGALWRLTAATMGRASGLAAAALGAVAALSAWQLGDGLRAGEALVRARSADADHGLARLLQRALDDGLPPQVWQEVMAGLTERDCRYGRGEDTAA